MGNNERSKKSTRPSLRTSRSAQTSTHASSDALSAKDSQKAAGRDRDASSSDSGSHASQRYSSRAGYKAKKNKELNIPKKESSISASIAGVKGSAKSVSSKAHIRTADAHAVPEQKEDPSSSIKHTLFPAHVNQRSIYKNNPRVYYMNGESLTRPLFFPKSYTMRLLVIVAVAIIIALVALYFYFDTTANAPARERAQVEELASRSINYDLPNLLSFVEMDDAAIDASLKESGAAFYEKTPLGQGVVYEIVKLPQDLTLEQAAGMYIGGIKNLSAADTVLLLNGSWVLSVDRSYGLNISLHYADFKSKTVDDAIVAAISSEDLERGGPGDSGDNDGYGNAYTTGTIMINGTNYIWTVSALPLKEFYKKSGLPDNATYVGIRIKNG